MRVLRHFLSPLPYIRTTARYYLTINPEYLKYPSTYTHYRSRYLNEIIEEKKKRRKNMWRCELDWTFRALLLWWRIQTRHGSSSSEELVARCRVDKILMKFLWIDFPLSFFLLCLHNIASSLSLSRFLGRIIFTPRELCVVVSEKVSENRKNTEFWCMWWRKMSKKSETTHNKERKTWLHFTSVTIHIVVASNVCNCIHTILWAVYADAPHFFHFSLSFIFESTIPSIVQSRWQPHGDSPAHTWWMCA